MQIPQLTSSSILIHPPEEFDPGVFFYSGFLGLPGIISKFSFPFSVSFGYNNFEFYGMTNFALIQQQGSLPTLAACTILNDNHFQILTFGYDTVFKQRILAGLEKRYIQRVGQIESCTDMELHTRLTLLIKPYFDYFTALDI